MGPMVSQRSLLQHRPLQQNLNRESIESLGFSLEPGRIAWSCWAGDAKWDSGLVYTLRPLT